MEEKLPLKTLKSDVFYADSQIDVRLEFSVEIICISKF